MKSLVYSKLFPSHITSPFDLHVLSTPPAFILSQDQTLMFYLPFPRRLRQSTDITRFLSRQLLSGFSVLGLPRTAYCFWVANLFASHSLNFPILCSASRPPTLYHLISSLALPLPFRSSRGFFRSWNFQGCIAVYLSRFIPQTFLPVCLCCQLSDNYNRISQPIHFVNRFLDFYPFYF